MQAMDNRAQNKNRSGHSACAAASRHREMARLRRLTVEARIKAALGLKTRFLWLKPAAVEI